MRTIRTYKVVTFHTVTEAMAMERFCEEAGIKGRLIPVPGKISAGCGMCFRTLPEDFPALEEKIVPGTNTISDGKATIAFENIHTIEM